MRLADWLNVFTPHDRRSDLEDSLAADDAVRSILSDLRESTGAMRVAVFRFTQRGSHIGAEVPWRVTCTHEVSDPGREPMSSRFKDLLVSRVVHLVAHLFLPDRAGGCITHLGGACLVEVPRMEPDFARAVLETLGVRRLRQVPLASSCGDVRGFLALHIPDQSSSGPIPHNTVRAGVRAARALQRHLAI